MPRYRQIHINGEWSLVDVNSIPESETSSPYIMGDIPEYTSPVDGRLISGRKQRREDLKRNGCVEYDPGMKDQSRRMREDRDRKLEVSLGEAIERTAIQLRDRMTKPESRINPAWFLEK